MFLLEEGEGFVDIVEFSIEVWISTVRYYFCGCLHGKFWLPYVRHFISLLALGSYEW